MNIEKYDIKMMYTKALIYYPEFNDELIQHISSTLPQYVDLLTFHWDDIKKYADCTFVNKAIDSVYNTYHPVLNDIVANFYVNALDDVRLGGILSSIDKDTYTAFKALDMQKILDIVWSMFNILILTSGDEVTVRICFID